ncbi:limonene-1,2-epoxide hydrolase family protein [Erythrobacter westpacificensis]|uniref:Limonene-1,2-epoxide hydrolase family protein n=1 Tax=Erythrobacter westpacificensis TaxID=1055231 RepID=A0ABP9KST7_9SPHN
MTDQMHASDSNSPESVVMTFIQCFNDNRIDDALSMLAEDVFYHNIPLPPMEGREATAGFFSQFDLGGAMTTQWIVHAIASKDDVVLTERTDKFFSATGKEVAIPIMGSFKVRDGLIAEWRDYFDLGDFEKQIAGLIA